MFPSNLHPATITTTTLLIYNTTLTGATITLRDAYQNTVATRTVAGTGGQASVTYEIGSSIAVGGDTFALNTQNYRIPDKPFVGPFTKTGTSGPGSPTANNIVGTNFQAASYAEVINFIQPSPITAPFIYSFTATTIVVKWIGNSDDTTDYTFTVNGIITIPSRDNLTATFSGLDAEINKYVIGITSSNAAGSLAPVFTTYSPRPTIEQVVTTTITSTSVTIVWTGGDGAALYLYTKNNLLTTASNDNALLGKTATFVNLTGNTEYLISVYAITSTASSIAKGVTFTTAPVNPTGFTYSNGILRWSGGDGATSYTILLNEVDVTSSVVIGVSAKQMTFNNLVGNMTYSCVVTAINTAGLASDSGLFTFQTAPIAPNLLLAGLTATSLSISWTGGDGASNYRFSQILYCEEDPNYASNFGATSSAWPTRFGTISGAGVTDGSVPVTAIAFNPVGQGNPVYLAQDGPKVHAVSGTNKQSYTGVIADFRYDLFTALSSTTTVSTQITFTATGNTPSANNTIVQSGTSISITGLAQNSSYVFGITAIGTGETTSRVSITTASGPPTALVLNTATNVSSTGCNISWSSGGVGATSYSPVIVPATATATMTIVGTTAYFVGLAPATAYSIRINAINSSGIGTYNTVASNMIQVTTGTSPVPSAIVLANSATAVTMTGFTVSWTGGIMGTIFNKPSKIAVDTADNLYVVDPDNNRICKIAPGGGVTTLTGGFNHPSNVAVDAEGNIYVICSNDNMIYKIASGGDITTLASGFEEPYSVAVDALGNVYASGLVADFENNIFGEEIHKITSGGVTKLESGYFNHPFGIAVDAAGNVYIADTDNRRIRVVTPGGVVSTLVSGLNIPNSVAVDAEGNVYVADSGNNRICKIASGGAVTTFASGFNNPLGVAVDAAGNVYVADYFNKRICKIESGGAVTTLMTGMTSEYSYSLNGAAAVSFTPSNSTYAFTGLAAGTSYSVRIIVNGISSISRTFSTILGAPVLNAATSITSTGFTVSWTGGAATSYTYTLSPSPGNPVFTYNTISKTGSFTGLSTGVSYSLTIAAVNAGGVALASNPITVTTIPTVSVNTSSITQSQATITWGAYAGATGAEGYAGTYTYNSISTTFTVNSNTLTKTLTGLSAGTSYTVEVKAKNGTTVLATFPSITLLTLPATPTLANATSITSSGFSITWTGSVVAGTDAVFTLNGIVTTPNAVVVTAGTATFTGLVPNTTYDVILKMRSSSGLSLASNTRTFTTNSTSTTITSSSITFNSFVVNWLDIIGVSSYIINISPPVSGISRISNISTTQHSFTGLTQNTSYTVTVEGGGTSASAIVETRSIQPTITNASSISQTGFSLPFSCAGGADDYLYTISPAGSPAPALTKLQGGTGGTFTFTGLTAGTNYTIHVIARNIEMQVDVSSLPASVLTLPGNFSSNGVPITDVTDTTCKLTWQPSSGATRYSYLLNGTTRVELPAGTVPNPTPSTECMVTGLVQGSTNTFSIRAHNASGYTDAAQISVLMKPAPPYNFSIAHTSTTWTPWFNMGNGATECYYSRHVDTSRKIPITNGAIQNYPTQGNDNWVNIYLHCKNASGDSTGNTQTLYFPPGTFNIYDADITAPFSPITAYKLAMNVPKNVTRITVYKDNNFDHVVNINQALITYNGRQVIFDDVIGNNFGHASGWPGSESPWRGHVRVYAYNDALVQIEADKGTWDGWVGT